MLNFFKMCYFFIQVIFGIICQKTKADMKHSFILFILIVLLLVIDVFLFLTYKKNIEDSFKKETDITFWQIETKSSELLSELLFKYLWQREKILQKHIYVKNYIENSKTDPLKLDLKPLYNKINKDLNKSRYNIYITDKNYIIKNTTFKNDLGFDLSFARDIFEKHYKNREIGVSTPLFESSTKTFFSYSDSYYRYKGDEKRGIMQISYMYTDLNKRLKELLNTIKNFKTIQDVKAFTKLNDGFVVDIKLGEYKSYKPDVNEVLKHEKEGKTIDELLKNSGLKKVENKDSIYYFFSAKSPIYNDMSILYYVEFSKNKLKQKLFRLNVIAFAATVISLIIFYMVLRLFQTEQRFMWQDFFMQSSMHQLKTPLSIIRINNDMQKKVCKESRFSQNIEAAIKTLQNSFEDMHFFFKDKKVYNKEKLSLKDVLEERVEYFNNIAGAYEKTIEMKCYNELYVEMSKEELTRLIDNNLSNGIKYAKPTSVIQIVLKENSLSFTTNSKPIKDKQQIFSKYFREDNTKGGHGLGLFIVKSIAEKYGIRFDVISKDNMTTFSYEFKEA